jgi:hypothetical protein
MNKIQHGRVAVPANTNINTFKSVVGNLSTRIVQFFQSNTYPATASVLVINGLFIKLATCAGHPLNQFIDNKFPSLDQNKLKLKFGLLGISVGASTYAFNMVFTRLTGYKMFRITNIFLSTIAAIYTLISLKAREEVAKVKITPLTAAEKAKKTSESSEEATNAEWFVKQEALKKEAEMKAKEKEAEKLLLSNEAKTQEAPVAEKTEANTQPVSKEDPAKLDGAKKGSSWYWPFS